MPEIIDLEMSDEEYLQLLAEGRDPVLERLYARQLQSLGVFPEATRQHSQLSEATKKCPNRMANRVGVSILGLLACLLIGGVILGIFKATKENTEVIQQTGQQSSNLKCHNLPAKPCSTTRTDNRFSF
jgi:hypothetical protein